MRNNYPKIRKESMINEHNEFVKWIMTDENYGRLDDVAISELVNSTPKHIHELRETFKPGENLLTHSLCVYCNKCCQANCPKGLKPILHGEVCDEFEYGRITGIIDMNGAVNLLEVVLDSIGEEYNSLRKGKHYNKASTLKHNVCNTELFALCGVTEATFEDITAKRRK